MKNQGGWTGSGTLAVLLCAAMGGILAHYIISSLDQNSPPTVQWGLISVFLLPLTFATQLWVNFNGLREIKGITGSERRRITETVKAKLRQIQFAILFYALSALVIGFGLLFSTGNWKVYHAITVFTGLSLGISMASLFLILNESRELSEFKNKISERAQRNKQLGKKLTALQSKEK
jgi:MFS family permease